jgi:hypothetical protein
VNYVRTITVDRNNVKWFGTTQGVSSFDGKEWRTYKTTDGLAGSDVFSSAVDLNNVKWFGTGSGVSRFDGKTWKTYTDKDGLVRNDVFAIAVDHNNVKWFGTGNGLSRYEDGITSVLEPLEDTPLDITFSIVPNPFNPSTTLAFTLPAPGRTTLTIYDITGRKVRTLFSEFMAPGAHAAIWDGRDERGGPVSSGVYLARLESGRTATTAKMLLMK